MLNPYGEPRRGHPFHGKPPEEIQVSLITHRREISVEWFSEGFAAQLSAARTLLGRANDRLARQRRNFEPDPGQSGPGPIKLAVERIQPLPD